MDDLILTDRECERFWAKVSKTDTCWIWHGHLRHDGYGLFDRKFEGRRVVRMVHRIAYALTVGDPGPLLMHECDVRACCNPQHLRPGTPKENIQGMVERGRHWTATNPERIPRGDDHWSRKYPEKTARGPLAGNAKLSAPQVESMIRQHREGVTQRQLAQTFGVSQAAVWKVLSGRTYIKEVSNV